MVAALLVFHGSRDARPQQAMTQLADWLRACLDSSGQPCLVETAMLELGEYSLSQQIQQFGDRARQVGLSHLYIVPLFLLAGTHVMDDIPAEVAAAQQHLGQDCTLTLLPHLGCHPVLPQLLQHQLVAHKSPLGQTPERWILLSHGSRRPGGNQSIVDLATQLNAVPAFWAVSPSLPTQVKTLVEAGYQQIGIMPYFLFPGRILDAIAETITELQRDLNQQFPTIQLQLTQPIQATPQLATLLAQQFIHHIHDSKQ